MKHFLVLVLALFVGGTHATSVGVPPGPAVHVTNIRTGGWYGTMVTVKTSAPASPLGCATLGDRGDYVFDSSTPEGLALYAAVLTAFRSVTNVRIWGSGACMPVNSLAGEILETISVD